MSRTNSPRALRRSRRGLVLATALVAGTAWSALPVTADAATPATVEIGRNREILYRAAPGQTNRVVLTDGYVEEERVRYTIDDVVPIRAGAGCEIPDADDPTRAYCFLSTVGDFVPYPTLWLGDRNDRAEIDDVFGDARMHGEAGDDTLLHTDGGGAYGDVVEGGDGNDVILCTGGGYDRIYGGRGDDYINGGDSGDLVYGNSGDDYLLGSRGNDNLFGGPDDDTVYGNSGNDQLTGGPGRDRLSGGPGRDTIRP